MDVFGNSKFFVQGWIAAKAGAVFAKQKAGDRNVCKYVLEYGAGVVCVEIKVLLVRVPAGEKHHVEGKRGEVPAEFFSEQGERDVLWVMLGPAPLEAVQEGERALRVPAVCLDVDGR